MASDHFNLSSLQAAVAAIALFVVWRIAYRSLRNRALAKVAGPPSSSWWSGNFLQVFNKNGYAFHVELAKKYGSAVRVHGYFGAKQLYVFDPLAMHHIFVKSQYIYEETGEFIARNRIAFGTSLLSTLGDHHRKQRKMLNPVFSLKHMRGLIPVFYPIAHRLHEVLTHEVEKADGDINVMKWMSRAALEYIGQGGLGYSFDALDETKTNTYSEVLKAFVPILFNLLSVRQVLPHVVEIGPAWLRRELLKLVPSRRIHRTIEIVDQLDKISRNIFAKKKEALQKGDEEALKQAGGGKDIMSVLLRANMEAAEGEKLPDEELLGQMNTFIFAGHDTTTSAICRILHQLALNPDVQTRLRRELTEARAQYGGDFDYDTLMNLPYLDAVCRETLRLFAPVPTVMRTTREDIVLPLAWPIKSADGKEEITSIPLEKNTDVIISIFNANRSTRIWGPDAGEWKPERWLSPLPESVAKAHMPGVYASMMTFIGGGRACIGFKFAEMEMKLVLSILLPTFAFSPGSQEIVWNMTNLQTPMPKGSTDFTPRLPLKVGFVTEKHELGY